MMRKKRNNRKFRVRNNPIKSFKRKKRIINQKITKMLKSNLIVIVKKRQKQKVKKVQDEKNKKILKE